jgi:hypothetical protein
MGKMTNDTRMSNDEVLMTNQGAKMSNDQILMTNQFPNDSMTKPARGYRSSFVHSMVIRASTFVILRSFFRLKCPLFCGKLMGALGGRQEVKICV